MSPEQIGIDYGRLLEHSFKMDNELSDHPKTRLGYLSHNIFDFTTYDSDMDELFAQRAVEVCAAINNQKTFEYIASPENYQWYLLMCNMPFFVDRLEWGGSIRGAWWCGDRKLRFELQSFGLWFGNDQLTEPLTFTLADWHRFIAAVVAFARNEQSAEASP